MQIFFCILIFIMGTVFGSFFTLAVYRIPLNKNILYERSFCPNCNHRLEFFDLIPIISYISLKGKCRYCKEKVRIRYLILEFLSGCVFLVSYLSLKMKFPFFEIDKVVYYIAFVMFFVTVVLISGIDKEKFYIDKRVLLFGILMQILYEIYLYVFKHELQISFQYLILLLIIFVIFIIDTISLKKFGETKYLFQIIMFITYLIMFFSIKMWWMFAGFSIIIIILYYGYKKIKVNMVEKPDILQELPSRRLPVGFCVGISSIMTVIISNFIFF